MGLNAEENKTKSFIGEPAKLLTWVTALRNMELKQRRPIPQLDGNGNPPALPRWCLATERQPAVLPCPRGPLREVQGLPAILRGQMVSTSRCTSLNHLAQGWGWGPRRPLPVTVLRVIPQEGAPDTDKALPGRPNRESCPPHPRPMPSPCQEASAGSQGLSHDAVGICIPHPGTSLQASSPGLGSFCSLTQHFSRASQCHAPAPQVPFVQGSWAVRIPQPALQTLAQGQIPEGQGNLGSDALLLLPPAQSRGGSTPEQGSAGRGHSSERITTELGLHSWTQLPM